MKRIIYLLSAFLFSTLIYANGPDNISENTEKSLLEGLKSENIGLQVSSAIILGEIKSENAVNPLTQVLRTSNDTRARKAAAQSLVKIGTERSIYVIKQAARFNDNEQVQDICAKLLCKTDQKSKIKYDDKYAVK